MNRRSLPVGRGIGPALCAAAVFLAALAAPASRAHGGSIFDDDWVPNKNDSSHPAAPVEPVRPEAKVGVPSVKPPSAPAPPHGTKPAPTRAPRPAGTPRRAIPNKADLDRSRTLLKEAFAKQLEDRTIPARHKLAETLLTDAAQAGASPSDQFVLFGGALNAAREAACLPLVFQAADEMSRLYAVDAEPMKAAAALSMPLKSDTTADSMNNVLAGLELIDALVAADDFHDAARLCVTLWGAAASDPGLAEAIQKRGQEINVMHLFHDQVLPQLQRLKTRPDDPAANLAVGSYECFIAGDWPGGLRKLAQGSDPKLKELAADDLSRPADADARVALGDAWWDLAAARPPGLARTTIREHAVSLYDGCQGKVSPLQRIKIENRIAECAASRSGPAATVLDDAIVRRRLDRIREFVAARTAGPDSARVPMPQGDPLEGDVAWKAIQGGYSLSGTLLVGHNAGNHGKQGKDCSAKLKVDPGFSIEGGTLLVSKGSLDLNGEASKPIVFKNVHLSCELTGYIKASHVIFEDCTFTKEGPFSWVGYPSAKFDFKDCLLLRSNFRNLGFDDYGIKLDRCTFASCKFPPRNNKPGKNEDSAKKIRHEWSHVADCQFYNCELSASVFWLPQRCNFFRCKATDAAAFASPGDLTVELGLLSDERDPLLSDLNGRMTMTGAGRVIFTAAPTLYPALAPAGARGARSAGVPG